MASYQLIKEAGEERTLDLHRKNCAVRIDGGHGGDVESAFQKINPSSPRLKSGFSNGANVPSGCTPSSPRLVSLDVFRGLTVVPAISYLLFYKGFIGGILVSTF